MNPSSKIITLLYHRIYARDTDPWVICVSTEHFEEQLQVIKEHLPVITSSEAADQIIHKKIQENSVCITFDDGYEDNYTHALPILKRNNCPATFFIATAFTGSRIPYWWDELELICLHSNRLPAQLQLSVSATSYKFGFETELCEDAKEWHRSWKWYDDVPTKRCDSFLRLWNLLRPLPCYEIEKQMDIIRDWSQNNFQTRLPMNEVQLQKLSIEKLATIGLHTHSHPDLKSHQESIQKKDILTGKDILQNKYGIATELLAYPYGRYNNATFAVARELDLKAGFTTAQAPATNESKAFEIGRYQVFDWNAYEFEQQLLGWLSL